MKLEIKERAGKSKSEVNSLRRNGRIPSILYVRGKEGVKLSVDQAELQAHMRTIPQGFLSTCVFNLVDENGKERRAIIKEIQYHRTTYDMIHLDFEELHDKTPINVKVPIEFTHVADCVGIKLGGVLRKVIRSLKVRCFPKDLPKKFQINVQELSINQSKRLSAITMPEGVRPLMDLKEVACVIAKR